MPKDYDRGIHSSTDATRWARFFCDTMNELKQPCPDEDTMRGWFANAMMAERDHGPMAIRNIRAGDGAPGGPGSKGGDGGSVYIGRERPFPPSHMQKEEGGAYCGAKDEVMCWAGGGVVDCIPCLRACVAHQAKILDDLISAGVKVPPR